MGYTYSKGQWGSYADNIESWDQFHSMLKRLEFTDRRKLDYLLGEIVVFSRTSNAVVKWPYTFVCTLSVGYGAGSYWVWSPGLPDVLQLLKEVGAKEKDLSSSGDSVVDLIDYLRDSTFFGEAMHSLHEHLRKIELENKKKEK